MNFLKKNWLKLLLLAVWVGKPIVSFAQGKLINPIEVDSISCLIKILLEGALKIGIPLIALAIIYCGFLFVAARGNSEKLGKAKDALLYTLIGAAILLGSWAIAELISATVAGLGTDALSITDTSC